VLAGASVRRVMVAKGYEEPLKGGSGRNNHEEVSRKNQEALSYITFRRK